MIFLSKFKQFIKDLYGDVRIPKKDKIIVLLLLTLIVSPLDFIPDWFPVIGQLDDMMMIALILDYFFVVIDHDVLLSNYPWKMKSFSRLRQMAKLFNFIIPNALRKRLWKYVGSPY